MAIDREADGRRVRRSDRAYDSRHVLTSIRQRPRRAGCRYRVDGRYDTHADSALSPIGNARADPVRAEWSRDAPMTTTPDPAALLPAVLALVEEAGAAIMAVYATGHDVEYKADDSPITRADRAAHEILSEGLARLAPAIPVLSEESEASHAYAVRSQWRQLWLVDPLDGTRGVHQPQWRVHGQRRADPRSPPGAGRGRGARARRHLLRRRRSRCLPPQRRRLRPSRSKCDGRPRRS